MNREAQERAVFLPTGTVTFLFTDIEGSSQRWETHRQDMDGAVKRHDMLMRSAMEAHGGHIFKTVGDSFCVVFARVSDAVAACVDAQRSLSAEDFSAVEGLHVRSALHTGEAVERNGDYFGPAVNRVARLMSIGYGGQILLSGVTRDLAHRDLPSGASLADLGSQRLKDLTEPEQVWQLNLTNLPTEFPPLRSLDTLPNNLPLQKTTFVGRERDVAEVKELLAHHRLLTLVGSGGVGKTRLALQVGAELLDHYPDGVWLVDFAPITDPELVSSVIAKVLGMSQQEGRRVDESIPPWLKRKKLLLILDNCEHVLENVAGLSAAILNTAQEVRILSTSRQMFGISGEEFLRLPSLDVPHKIADLTPAVVLEFGAIALFVDRARSVDRSFALTDDTAPIVADICRRLDGIPLAIELAAARVKVLSIPNLAQRLNERFKILTSGSRDVLPRQKTLSALIDWSYDLLTPREQLLFRRLGVFASGFGLDAATTVCGGQGLDEIEILDLLTSLTDKSLVVADTGGEQERYHLLESTRAYALDKLAAKGDRDSLARRHAEYFCDQAQTADERYGKGSTLAWSADVDLELDNYRAALEWTLTQGNDAVVGGAIAGALEWLWSRGLLSTEGRYWIGLALDRLDVAAHPTVVARVLCALSELHSAKAKAEAAERAIQLYKSAGDDLGGARSRLSFAIGLFQMGKLDEASREVQQALATLRERGKKIDVARCLVVQGNIVTGQGDMALGHSLYAQALAIRKAIGDELGSVSILTNFAEREFNDGHAEEALRLVSEALSVYSRGRTVDPVFLALCYVNGAAYRIALSDLEGARTSARNGLNYSRQIGNKYNTAIALQHLALIMALQEDLANAARLCGYVDAQYKELGGGRERTEKWGYDKLMATIREQLSEAEIEKLAAEGTAWSEDQAVEEALR